MKKLLYGLTSIILLSACQPEPVPTKRWYKGNLHTHSLWSDGDDYPEMIMDWYKSNGYQFVALSDHNILQEGEKWVRVPQNPIRRGAFEEYVTRFGADWVDYREDSVLEVRLKRLKEYRSLFEVADSFLIIRSEEISDSYDGKPIHLNATNVQELIEPQHGNSVAEVMQNNINAVLAQRERTSEPMFPHLNHPNFGWAVTMQDMIQLENERFFEVYNGHPAVNNYSDSTRMGTEEMWDRINIAYAKSGKPLLFGLAVDDSHNYHTFGLEYSNTGRGWVMVEANELSPASLINAMEGGHFYASTGVELAILDTTTTAYTVQILPEDDVRYTIQFMGATRGGELRIFKEVQGIEATYQAAGNELFIRAKIISDREQENPFREGDWESAWTQPVLLNAE